MKTIVSSVPKSTTMNIIMLFFITTLMVLVMASCSKNSGPMPEPTPPTPPPTPTPTFTTYTTGANPSAICADSSGNVWIANYSDNTVTEVLKNGKISTFNVDRFPVAICYDYKNAVVYTANLSNTTGDGSISTIDNGIVNTYHYPTTTKGSYPISLVINNDTLIVINTNSITKMSIVTKTMTQWMVPKTFRISYLNVFDIGAAIDKSGNIWVPNNDTCSVTKISSNGEIIRYINNFHQGVASTFVGMVSCGGNMWTADFVDHGVVSISPLGEMNLCKSGLSSPTLAITSGGGCVYTINGTDISGYGSISKYNVTDGTSVIYQGIWQNDDYAICYDTNNNLWVVDYKTNSVIKVTLPK